MECIASFPVTHHNSRYHIVSLEKVNNFYCGFEVIYEIFRLNNVVVNIKSEARNPTKNLILNKC